ncbi:MAG: DEAD/DEAH box helicase family protein [Thermoplasmata archaeon]
MRGALPVNDEVLWHQLKTADYLYDRLRDGPVRVQALCDPVGFGKTYTALFAISAMLTRSGKKALVVLPNQRLLAQWENELEQFLDHYIRPRVGHRLRNSIELRTIHDIYMGWVNRRRRKYEVVVVDEAHRLKTTYQSVSSIFNGERLPARAGSQADAFSTTLWGSASSVLFLTATPFPKETTDFPLWFRRGIEVVYGGTSRLEEHLSMLKELHEELSSYQKAFSSILDSRNREIALSNIRGDFRRIMERLDRDLRRYMVRANRKTLSTDLRLPEREERDEACSITDPSHELIFMAQEIELHDQFRSAEDESLRPYIVTEYLSLCSSFDAFSHRRKKLCGLRVPSKGHPKVTRTLELIMDCIVNGEKVLVFTERVRTKRILVERINEEWASRRRNYERSIKRRLRMLGLWGKLQSGKRRARFGVPYIKRSNKLSWHWLLFRPNAWDLCRFLGVEDRDAEKVIKRLRIDLQALEEAPPKYKDKLLKTKFIVKKSKFCDYRLAWWMSYLALLESLTRSQFEKRPYYRRYRTLRNQLGAALAGDMDFLDELIGMPVGHNNRYPAGMSSWFCNKKAAMWRPFAEIVRKNYLESLPRSMILSHALIDTVGSVLSKDVFLLQVAPGVNRKTRGVEALLFIHESAFRMLGRRGPARPEFRIDWQKRVRMFLDYFSIQYMKRSCYKEDKKFREVRGLLRAMMEASPLEVAAAVGDVVSKEELESEDEDGFYVCGRSLPRAIQLFNLPFYPRVLVGTPKDSESINLQDFCHRVIHHDLPFSPLRLEQRIGRVQRIRKIGSEEVTKVFTFSEWINGTYDDRIRYLVNSRRKYIDFLLDPSLEVSPEYLLMDGKGDASVDLDDLREELRTLRAPVLAVPPRGRIGLGRFPLRKDIRERITRHKRSLAEKGRKN